MRWAWITGIAYGIFATYLLITWWVPTVFTTVSNMFENSDLGTLIGLGAAYLTIGGYIVVSVLIGIGLIFLIAYILDAIDAKKAKRRAAERRNSLNRR